MTSDCGMEVIVFDQKSGIGRSDHSTIFEGRFRSEIVAVKRAKDPEGSRRNSIEAAQLRKLRHENVVKLFESGYNPFGRVDIVLELAQGGTLADALGSPKIRAEEWKRSTVYQIANGLAYIHNTGVQHRDLKPQNILFKDCLQERVLIADFGMATCDEIAEEAGAKVFRCPADTGAYTKANDVYCLAQISCCIVEMENPTGRVHLTMIRDRALDGEVLRRNKAWLKMLRRCLFDSRDCRPSAADLRDAFDSSDGIGQAVAGLVLLGIGAAALWAVLSDQKKEKKRDDGRSGRD